MLDAGVPFCQRSGLMTLSSRSILGFATLLFAACTTVEPSAPNIALIKCPASPEQVSVAKAHVNRYLKAVASGHRAKAKNRYIAVETLRPNKKQTAAYIKKRKAAAAEAAAKNEPVPSKWVEPSQLSCVCIFDTESKQFVGTDCYVVGSLPAEDETDRYDTISAEFVGVGP